MPTVVADSSAFIHLGAIGRVQLLRALFGQILVPAAVWQEVVEAERLRGPGRFRISHQLFQHALRLAGETT